MFRRFIGFSLLFAFLLSLVAIPPVHAADAVISVTASAPDANRYFDAVVSMSGNPGIATFTLDLHFDKERIVPNETTAGANFAEAMSSTGESHVRAFWYSLSNVDGDGVLFTVRFRILPEVSENTALTLSAGDISNISFEDVDFALVGTTVMISPATATEPVISVTASVPDEDGYFDVTVLVGNNPGIATFTLDLHFDRTKVNPISTTPSSIFPGTMLNIRDDHVRAFWYNSFLADVKTDGTMFTVRFQVLPGVSGNAEFTLSAGDISNISFDDIDFALVNASVNLDEPETPELIEGYIFEVCCFPAGLSLNPNTGVITGAGTAAGTYDVKIIARDEKNPHRAIIADVRVIIN
jgi:hypothetical protein